MHLRKNAGFTLVESLLYFALVAMLLVTVSTLFVTLLQEKVTSSSLSRVERDSQFIQARMAYDIRRASAIVTPANSGDTSSILKLTIGGQEVTYQLVNNQLQYTAGTTTALLQTETNMQSFTVQRLGQVGGKPTVKINYAIQSLAQTERGPQIQSYQTTIGIR